MGSITEVLILTDWYLPGYKAGGPIQSVANIVSQLCADFKFSIITRDTDFGEKSPYPGIKSDTWIELERNVRAYYVSESNLNKVTLEKLIKESNCSVVYMNSLFSYSFTILPLLFRRKADKRKYMLAPRGMLGKGALQLKSMKKKLFVMSAKGIGLYNNVLWQATNEAEESDIHSVFGDKAKVSIVSNIVASPSVENVIREKQANDLRMVFLSRISEKKNLQYFIEILSNLKTDGKLLLDIIGPIEDKNYWSKVEKSIQSLPVNVEVNYRGAIEYNEIKQALQNYHLFVLPTMHENFGHVVYEAFSAGCPALLSDQTPWRNLAAEGVGWDLSLSDEGAFGEAIEHCVKLSQQDFNAMSARAWSYAKRYAENDTAVEQMKLLLIQDA